MEKIKREPLLYIHQPGFKKPEVNMQGHFSIKKSQIVKDEEIEAIDNERNEEVQSQLEKYNEENGRTNSLRRLKPFKEMTLHERLDYLEKFPKHIPPVPCIFQTETETVRGIFVSKTENEVTIKQFDQSEKTLPIKNISSIVMMGLN